MPASIAHQRFRLGRSLLSAARRGWGCRIPGGHRGAVYLLSPMADGLVPQEDQGFVLAAPFLPPASAMGRTEAFRDDFTEQLIAMDEVEDVVSFAGRHILAGSLRPNAGAAFVILSDWSERTGEGQDAQSLAGRFMGMGGQMEEGNIMAFVPPPIQGLSLTGGVDDRQHRSQQRRDTRVQQAPMECALQQAELPCGCVRLVGAGDAGSVSHRVVSRRGHPRVHRSEREWSRGCANR